MLATLTADYFSDPDWIFEPKLDGIRCLAFKRTTGVEMFTRNKLALLRQGYGGHPRFLGLRQDKSPPEVVREP
ncbi:MAG: hypothetical protein GEU78_02900 [Actinobacteria bacterium]|nr:hypothetical protein [Actinomycetota bacterium]